MGWSQTLEFPDVDADIVETILGEIDAHPPFGGPVITNEWGWTAECDVRVGDHEVLFSGSWSISGDTDLPERFLDRAVERGFIVGSLSERT